MKRDFYFIKPLIFFLLFNSLLLISSNNKFIQNQKELELKENTRKFLSSSELIESLLNLSKEKVKEFPKISLLKIIEETIKFIKNNQLINNIEKLDNKNETLLCKGCIWTFNSLNFLIKEFYKTTKFLSLFENICLDVFQYDKDTCSLYINDYAPAIVDSLIDSHITGNDLCSNKYFCKNLHIKYLNPDEYAKELLADKPAYKPSNKTSKGENLKILHLTDMHTDLGYTEGSNADCVNPVCCQKTDKKLKFLDDFENDEGL